MNKKIIYLVISIAFIFAVSIYFSLYGSKIKETSKTENKKTSVKTNYIFIDATKNYSCDSNYKLEIDKCIEYVYSQVLYNYKCEAGYETTPFDEYQVCKKQKQFLPFKNLNVIVTVF